MLALGCRDLRLADASGIANTTNRKCTPRAKVARRAGRFMEPPTDTSPAPNSELAGFDLGASSAGCAPASSPRVSGIHARELDPRSPR
jgi:hypothetical protein